MGKGGGVACERPVFELAVNGTGGNTATPVQRRPAGRPKRPGPEAAAKRLAGPQLKRLLQRAPFALSVEVNGILADKQQAYDRSRDKLGEVYTHLNPDRSNHEAILLHQQVEQRNAALVSAEHRRWIITSFQVAECIAGEALTPRQREAVEQAAGIAYRNGELLPGVEQTLMLLKQCGTTVSPTTSAHLKKDLSRQFGKLWVSNPTSHMASTPATVATLSRVEGNVDGSVQVSLADGSPFQYSSSFPEAIEMMVRANRNPQG